MSAKDMAADEPPRPASQHWVAAIQRISVAASGSSGMVQPDPRPRRNTCFAKNAKEYKKNSDGTRDQSVSPALAWRAASKGVLSKMIRMCVIRPSTIVRRSAPGAPFTGTVSVS